jgi:hypothetical protein
MMRMKYYHRLSAAGLIMLFLPVVSIEPESQQVVLEENFESEDLAADPAWTGDPDHFTFVREGPHTLLRLNSTPERSRSQLRTELNAAYGSWEFYFRQEFTASNLNRSFIFLLADREDLNYLDGSPVSGYAVRAGENGDPKRIRLIRFDSGAQHEILSSQTVLEPEAGYRIKVTRTREGEWQLHLAQGHENTPEPDSGTVVDDTYHQAGYFGLLLRYTTANTDRFYFDDIRMVSDAGPFAVDSVSVVDRQTLRVYFNRQPDTATIPQAVFQFENSPDPYEIKPSGDSSVQLGFSSPVRGGMERISITGLYDISGNPIESGPAEFLFALPAGPNDLVINEIMYDPVGPPDEYFKTGQSEYIEIFNRRSIAVSIDGLNIRDREELTSTATTIEPEASGTSWVPAGGYLLLYPENDETDFALSRVAQFFDLPGDIEPYAVRFHRSTLGLPMSGRTVVLSDSEGRVIDHVNYRPDWHNPNLIDTRGIALERVNPDLSSDNPSNWSSSTAQRGGTPGMRNSLYQQPEQMPPETGITLEPNPFSPFGDGNNDNLYINYRLDESDYLVRVRIFDRYGRLVRNLVESHPAGFEGSLIWDGRTDRGQDNRIGIYIILFEAFNSAAGRSRTFREAAVIARRF